MRCIVKLPDKKKPNFVPEGFWGLSRCCLTYSKQAVSWRFGTATTFFWQLDHASTLLVFLNFSTEKTAFQLKLLVCFPLYPDQCSWRLWLKSLSSDLAVAWYPNFTLLYQSLNITFLFLSFSWSSTTFWRWPHDRFITKLLVFAAHVCACRWLRSGGEKCYDCHKLVHLISLCL